MALPDVLYYLIWPFMQYGVFLTIPVLAVIALMLRRVRLAAAMAIAGVGVYLLARIVKELVKRGRPEALIGNIEARETFAAGSLGFPSGHVAVAAALTVVVTPHLRGRWRAVPTILAVIVGIGRMYVGASYAIGSGRRRETGSGRRLCSQSGHRRSAATRIEPTRPRCSCFPLSALKGIDEKLLQELHELPRFRPSLRSSADAWWFGLTDWLGIRELLSGWYDARRMR
jgi:hypothetical protein